MKNLALSILVGFALIGCSATQSTHRTPPIAAPSVQGVKNDVKKAADAVAKANEALDKANQSSERLQKHLDNIQNKAKRIENKAIIILENL